jgi:hypothetical protein
VEGPSSVSTAHLSVGLQGSFSWSRTHSSALSACFQLVFSFYSFIRLYKSSRITLLSYGISQLNTVIFNPCFATDSLLDISKSKEELDYETPKANV